MPVKNVGFKRKHNEVAMELYGGRRVEQADTHARAEDYIFHNGLRMVKPYYFDFICNVKPRWAGMSILELFCQEFPTGSPDYYRRAYREGRLRVQARVRGAIPPTRRARKQAAADIAAAELAEKSSAAAVTAAAAAEAVKKTSEAFVAGDAAEAVERASPAAAAAAAAAEAVSAEKASEAFVAGNAAEVAEEASEAFVAGSAAQAAEQLQDEAGLHLPLREGQVVRHFIHRHEPPVLYEGPLQLVGVTDDIVAVSKPATMPVHVTGQYRKNSVLAVLQAEHPHMWPLHTVHRLDKPVSGLLLFARSTASADAVRRCIEGREVEKVYLARVLGAFPAGGSRRVDAPLQWECSRNHASVPLGQGRVIVLDDGVGGGGGNDGISNGGNNAIAGGCDGGGRGGVKESVTDFRLRCVAPDGRTSLVECRPRTGRQHQIRAHLQYIGHPIANDVQYGGTYPGPVAMRVHLQSIAAARQRQQAGTAGPSPPWVWGSAPTTTSSAAAATGSAAATTGSAAATTGSAAATTGSAAATTGSGAAAAGAGGGGGGAAMAIGGASKVEDGAQPGAAPDAGGGATAAVADGCCCAEWPPLPPCPQELRDELCANCPGLPPREWLPNLHPLWLHALRYAKPPSAAGTVAGTAAAAAAAGNAANAAAADADAAADAAATGAASVGDSGTGHGGGDGGGSVQSSGGGSQRRRPSLGEANKEEGDQLQGAWSFECPPPSWADPLLVPTPP